MLLYKNKFLTAFQRPTLSHPRDTIQLAAIPEPHQGTSYNPPLDAHTELILKANAVEEQRAKEAERLIEVKERIGRAIGVVDTQDGVPEGMVVDDREVDDEEMEMEDGEKPIKGKVPERKTKQQKAKAARQRAEVS